MPKTKFPKGVEVVGSAIIENGKGEILLVKSPKWSDKWIMPGGHIEPGENIAEAILREAEEKVGLKLRPKGVINFGELINSLDFYRPAHFIYFDIVCRIKSGEVKLDKVELTEFTWVKPKEALRFDLAESYDETIKKYLLFF